MGTSCQQTSATNRSQPLQITRPQRTMGMYTDWGNLKIVSCGAWERGAGPGSSTLYRKNGRVGGVHFSVNEPSFEGAWTWQISPITRCRNSQVQ